LTPPLRKIAALDAFISRGFLVRCVCVPMGHRSCGTYRSTRSMLLNVYVSVCGRRDRAVYHCTPNTKKVCNLQTPPQNAVRSRAQRTQHTSTSLHDLAFTHAPHHRRRSATTRTHTASLRARPTIWPSLEGALFGSARPTYNCTVVTHHAFSLAPWGTQSGRRMAKEQRRSTSRRVVCVVSLCCA
jgi:hypothetical protein